METSSNPERLAVGRMVFSAAIWALFVLAAHELTHRFLPVTGSIPGPGLKMLGAQALAITLATLALLATRQPTHLITLRAALATAIWVCLIVFGHYLSHLDVAAIRETLAALREGMGMGALLASAFMLAVLLGLPFVPSVEMGLMMMTVFGREGAIAAWLATIAGLSWPMRRAAICRPTGSITGWTATGCCRPTAIQAPRWPVCWNACVYREEKAIA